MTIRKTHGFSLLELMIVLVIASLMTALTVPWFSGSVSHMNLKTSARQAAATLRHARSLAASENRIYASVADIRRQTLFITKDTDGNPADDQTRSQNLKIFQPRSGVSFSADDSDFPWSGNDRRVILFYPSGNSSGGKLILKNEKNQSYRILVDVITGSVRIEG
jgi:type II secretion system protein H